MNPNDRQAGFTLPELLIALALLGLLASYTLGALQNVSRARVIHERIDNAAEIEAVRHHLHQTMEAARSVFIQHDPTVPAVLAFNGTRTSISMVVPSDPRLERGGLYVVDYHVTAGQKLGTTRQLYRASAAANPGNPSPLTLLDEVTAVEFGYFGPSEKGGNPKWQDRWPRTDILPTKVSVDLSLTEKPGRQWQKLIVVVPGAH